MKTWWMACVALCGALALPIAAQDEKKQPSEPVEAAAKEPYKIGSTVDENLVWRDIDGKPYKVKDLRGKVVMIHFWSIVCPWEKQAEPKFKAFQERYKDKDVVMLAIASNQNELGTEPPPERDPAQPTYEKIRKRLKDWKITYPIILDHGNQISDLFQGKTTPHCFVIDPKGVIVYAGALDDDPKAEKGDQAKAYVRDAIDAALEEKTVEVKETKPYG
ncbi:MAG TPA: redoxin domain-containing protein [Planctomycetota bacterium]|nr:redoxin domain-containing protein [Planctomycetota bacterium]